MESKSPLPAPANRFPLFLAILSPLILGQCANLRAETSVYRCTTPDGRIEFRQSSCQGDSEEKEVWIEDRKTGWEPARTKIERSSQGSRKSHRRKSGGARASRSARAKQEEKCWKKRQSLDEVNWKLRRGYKPATGVKLRRKRRQYEAYIHEFCN